MQASQRCDYCDKRATYAHVTRHLGQQRDACNAHIYMLTQLLERIGGHVISHKHTPLGAPDSWPMEMQLQYHHQPVSVDLSLGAWELF